MKLVILGPVAAAVGGRTVHIDRAQRRAVLAFLLLRAGRAVTAGQLIDALWGADPPATAKRQVSAAVSAIRRALRAAGHDPVTATRGGYRITATADELDLLAFELHLDRGRRLARDGDLTGAVAAYRAGLAVWSGPPLGGVSGAFADEARSTLEDQRLTAQETMLGLELRCGGHHAAVTELARLQAAHPFREELAGLLMLALYRSGRPADALATYRRVHRHLADELGIEPGAALTELNARILRGDQALLVPDAAARTPPPRRFLPRDIPDFTGRSADLARLDELAAATPGAAAVLLVVGVGGIGKTALAVHWAHRVASRFPDGQLHLDLRGYDDRRPLPPAEALGAVLRALGVPPDRVPADPDEASALYRSTLDGRRVLILLDNAASVAQVRPLLPAAPGALLLVTSRSGLGGLVARDGARRLGLSLLPPAESVDLLTRVLGAERVAAEPGAAGALAAACGHLPLALRIAAANLAGRPGAGVAAHVRELTEGGRLGALTVTGDPRSSVRVIFDQSYRLLGDAEQRALRLLGCAPGPDLAVAAAAELLDRPVPDTVRVLRSLADAHLVTEHRPGRFTLHDLVREYARDRAGADETRAALARLVAWTVTGAEGAAAVRYPGVARLPAVVPPPGLTGEDARDWLTAEAANLIALIGTGTALGHPDAVWRLVFGCQRFFNATLERSTMLSLGRAALDASELSADPYARPAAELAMAKSYTTNGYDERGLPHVRRCLELARRVDWPDLEINAHNSLSIYRMLGGDLREAAEHARAAFDRSMAAGVEPPQFLGKLGLIEMLAGDLDTAADHFVRTLASRNHTDVYSRAITELNLAEVRTLQGRPDEAEDLLDDAVGLLREAGNTHVTALAQADLAVLWFRRGRRPQAWDLLAEARAALVGTTDVLARSQLGLRYAELLTAVGRHAEAVAVLEAALPPAASYGTGHPAAMILIGLARTYTPIDLGRAADAAAQAVDAARKGQFRLLEGQALTAAARVHQLAGRTADARAAAGTARRIHESTGHEPGLRETDEILGSLHPAR